MKTDHWSTPQFLIDRFKPTWDPCPLNATFDGLSIQWHGKILLNPPFSLKEKFVRKAISERKNCEILVMLLPAYTDTKLFAELYREWPIEFLTGKLKYGNAKETARFGSMLVFLTCG